MNKKIVIFNGSPRPKGNTHFLTNQFIKGASTNTEDIIYYDANKVNVKNCGGCLRCNLIKKCSITSDDWTEISKNILDADILVFATPIYFHHVTAPLKTIIDRFRSFLHIKITETGLIHTPYQEWKKDIVLILPMGSSDVSDAQPVIDLFNFITDEFGEENKLHIITGTRLAITNQVVRSSDALKVLYKKLGLPIKNAETDYIRNQKLLKKCFDTGKMLTFKQLYF